MHDWIFEPGQDPLTLPEQPWSSDPGAATWFPPAPSDDVQTWLFETGPKGDPDDGGPMFASLPDVIVQGERRTFDSWFLEDLAGMWSYGGGSVGDGGLSGGGDEWEPQYPPPPLAPCDLDAAMDGLAQAIEAMIKAMPDWNAREYGAYILRDENGYLHVGQFMRGETVAEAVLAGRDAPSLGYQRTIPAGWTVVGAVHSHPDVGYDGAADLVNRYPSRYPGGGDYHAFGNVIGISPHFAPAATFAQYILGPDGVTREFNWSEGNVTSSNDRRANDRSDLSSDRFCR